MIWSQQEIVYAASLLLPLGLWLSLRHSSKAQAGAGVAVYGPRWLPSFVSSILAAYRLSTDEENFLLDCKSYGPIVYLPWPLCQYLVLDSAAVQSIYNTPSKSLVFAPIRNDMNYTVFNCSVDVFNSRIIEKSIFPAHARGLARGQLPIPTERFVNSVESSVFALGEQVDKAGGTLEVELVDVLNRIMFEGATDALFGLELCSPSFSQLTRSQLRETFVEFDTAFPLLATGLAAGMLPSRVVAMWPRLAKGVKARRVLIEHFAGWAKAGLPGLEEGVTKEIVDLAAKAGVGQEEIGKILLGSFWALQANAPFAAVHHLLYATQSPLLPSLLAELDAHLVESPSPYSFSTLSSPSTLPLLNSSLYETLRLSASSFSIRLVMDREGYVFQGTEQAIPPIPYHSRIICCATRLLDVEEEEDSEVWDGERFVGEEGRRKAAREVRAFGGGISVCEGRALALAKLKAMTVLLLSTFDFQPIAPSKHAITKDLRELRFPGGAKGVAPKTLNGRAGMGVRQVAPNAPFRVTRRVVA